MKLYHWVLLLAVAVVSGCSTTSVIDRNAPAKGWAILPVTSLTSQEAGIQLERILAVLLSSKGVKRVELPPTTLSTNHSSLLNTAHRLQNATQWAVQHNIKFGLNGSVDKWESRNDGRFIVGVTLRLTDIETGEDLWTISGESEGLAGDDPVEITRKLTRTLMIRMPLNLRAANG